MEISPDSLRTHLILLALTVAGIDLGIAFLMRAVRESGEASDRD